MTIFLRVSTEMNGEKSVRIQISAVSCRAHGNELSIVLYGSRTSQSEERDGPGAFGWRFLTLCSIRGFFCVSPISVLRIRAKCKLPAVRAVEFRVLFVFRNAGSYDL